MTDNPLNLEALEAGAQSMECQCSKHVIDCGEYYTDCPRHVHYPNAVSAYLAFALPEVTTFEESDSLPVGSVVLDFDGNTARRFPGGWRTTVVEKDGRVWLSGEMQDPELPARVLHQPKANAT